MTAMRIPPEIAMKKVSDLTAEDARIVTGILMAQAKTPPDWNTADGIKETCRRLADNPMIRQAVMTPARGTAACAMIDRLLTLPGLKAGDRIDMGDLARVAKAVNADAGDTDILHAVMILCGDWAGLLRIRFIHKDHDGNETQASFDDMQHYFEGEPRHPANGQPDPGFGERTVCRYHATEKLVKMCAFTATA